MEMHQLEGEMSFEKNILFPKYKQNSVFPFTTALPQLS